MRHASKRRRESPVPNVASSTIDEAASKKRRIAPPTRQAFVEIRRPSTPPKIRSNVVERGTESSTRGFEHSDNVPASPPSSPSSTKTLDLSDIDFDSGVEELDGAVKGWPAWWPKYRAYVQVPMLNVFEAPPLEFLQPTKPLTTVKPDAENDEDFTNGFATRFSICDQPTPEEELILPEETLDELDHSTDSSSVDRPVRYLDDFTILDKKTGTLLTLDDAQDPKLDNEAYFIGRVSAKRDLLEEPEEDDLVVPMTEVIIHSTALKDIWELEYPEGDGEVTEYSEVWVCTRVAWYILNRPSTRYRNLFLPRWLRHKILLLITFLAPKGKSLERFYKHFLRNEAQWAKYEFGRPLTKEDLNHHLPSILQFADRRGHPVSSSPLFLALCQEHCPDLVDSDADTSSVSSFDASSFCFRERRHGRGLTLVDKRLTETFCTPLVLSISKRFFPSLCGAGETSGNCSESTESTRERNALRLDIRPPLQSPQIVVGGPGASDSRHPLYWVKVGWEVYKLGDTVLIRPDSYSESLNTNIRFCDVPQCVWFGMIISLHHGPSEDDLQKAKYLDLCSGVYAHIQWFEPAARTSLGELAHPQELVVIDECASDIDVESFIGLCNNRKLGPSEDEPLPTRDSLDYFYRYYWDREGDDAFISVETFLPTQTSFCASCRFRATQSRMSIPRITRHGVSIEGVEYHIDDFVYILPNEAGVVYHIGQIRELDDQQVVILHLERASRSCTFYDERLLIASSPPKIRNYPIDSLEGKCTVFNQHPSTIHQDDVFFCPNLKDIKLCKLCPKPALTQKPATRLAGLDLFCGAGGLSIGLESVGLVETKWAVEYDTSSKLTFRKVHPNAIIYDACINDLLRNAYARCNGEAWDPVLSLDDEAPLPPFPNPGEVDVLFGGPPCQGFTRLNHCPKADDPRNRLVLSFLSAVDIIRPRYVIMENVRGILHFPLGGNQLGPYQIEGGIRGGFMKLIRRIFTAMNYQVRYGVLQAAHYGVPQTRRRVFFIATLRGTTIPQLPQPSHVSQDLRLLTTSMGDNRYHTISRRRNGSAPLPEVSIMDSIGDLPPWEWKHPHIFVPSKPLEMIHEKERAKNIETVNSMEESEGVLPFGSGPRHPLSYSQDPSTSYQQKVRGACNTLTQHWCPRFSLREIERICSIPLIPGQPVDHNDLPDRLRLPVYGIKNYNGYYGRLDGDRVFKTIVGRLSPNQQTGEIIHPLQRRIITLREMARAQGFPDSIEFQIAPTVNNILAITRQIGNAVPIPMAAAIGREILGAYLIDKGCQPSAGFNVYKNNRRQSGTKETIGRTVEDKRTIKGH